MNTYNSNTKKATATKIGINVTYYCKNINGYLEFGHASLRLSKFKYISLQA